MRRFSLSSLRSSSASRERKKSLSDGFENADTDMRLMQLHRVIASTHPGHMRQLPGHSHLHLIFGQNRRLDRLSCGIDCDEVWPNIIIGDE